MNRLLLGSNKLFTCLGSVFLIVALFIPAFAQDDGALVSGVVKPKVSTLNPRPLSTSPQIDMFVFPSKYSSPYGITIDKKDRIWVTEMAGNSLAVFDPSTNKIQEYRIPSTKGLPEVDWEYDNKNKQMPERTVTNYSVGNPGNVIVDKDGIVWFVMQLGNSIARFDPEKEEFTEILIPTANSRPYDLASDSTGKIWFVEKNNNSFGYLDFKSQKLKEIKMGEVAQMMGIAIDKKDNVWVGDVAGNYIGRYQPSTKKFKKFPITVPGSAPSSMRFDKNGILWICNLRSQQLGVLMTDSGIYSVVDLPGWNAVPQALAVDEDGKVWIVDSMTNQIGYFDQNKLSWYLFTIPITNSQPMNMAIDSQGDVWFTMNDRRANSLARLSTATVPLQQTESEGAGQATNENETSGSFVEIIGNKAVLVGLVIFSLIISFFLIQRVRSR